MFREEGRKWIEHVQVIKTERKIIHISDGVKTKAFNVAQVMPVVINNAAEYEVLKQIYEHSDRTSEEESEQKEAEQKKALLTEILKAGTYV